jgi:hypothetical protein
MMGRALLRETQAIIPISKVPAGIDIIKFVTEAPFSFRYEGAAVSQAAFFVYSAAFLFQMCPTVSL